MNYKIYICDTETTGLDFVNNSPIEISIIRYDDGIQKTWLLKALNEDKIDIGALKLNNHKLEDITHKTKFGKDNYKDPAQVIVDIENWISEDDCSSDQRILVGQNISFDKTMLEFLWKKLNSHSSFPFGRRIIDTMQNEFMIDLCLNSFLDNYSLNSLLKKYSIKNDKSHSAAADTKATYELFKSQVKKYTDGFK